MYLSEKIAASFGRTAKSALKLDDNNEKIIVYGAINLIQIFLNIFWVVVFGFIFGALYEALIFSFVVATLRKYSGGGHASSPGRCLIIGTTFTTIFAVLIKRVLCNLGLNIIIFVIGITITISFYIVYKNSPVDSIKKPIKHELRKNFRKKSMSFMTLMCIIIIGLFALNKAMSNIVFIEIIEVISLGLLFQSISLTRGGIFLFNNIDILLKYLINGGELNEE
jgi:accessory gene regulator B